MRVITGRTQVVGVMGYPVEHSLSPAMHNAAFEALNMDWIYVPLLTPPENIQEAIAGLRAMNFRGANITVPLKELIPPLMDELSEVAKQIGAVNTVCRQADGSLYGTSTDGVGFLRSLEAARIPLDEKLEVVVLGTGGSARAVANALVQLGAKVTVVSRHRDRAAQMLWELGAEAHALQYSDPAVIHAMHRARVLVNTTPLGLYPHVEEMPPIPLEGLHPDMLVYDLIYNPPVSRLLREAQKKGCATMNGVKMLVYQGAESFQLWTGQYPPVDAMEQAVRKALGMEFAGQVV
ncbi:MAG: shikimate dehydrogenase [Armatimonadota bacterium]|nr:shikimate dehydrogenase [bacterium]MCS7310223.1 shikimate dehydrogenase [Armatimonadota bacterium]MDW8104046.1 shikimate dehydrogenase [Armatimonadota bacterium]MDW8290454.1 shikimate dehydrogenase [Armatimonadota bacterium]